MTPAPPPPGAIRVIWITSRLSARKFLNRATGVFSMKFGRKKSDPPAARTGTPRKRMVSFILFPFLLGMFALNGVGISMQMIVKLSAELKERRAAGPEEGRAADTRIAVGKWQYRAILEKKAEWRKIRKGENGDPRRDAFLQSLRESFEYFVDDPSVSKKDQAEKVEKMMAAFEERGSAGFRVVTERATFFPSESVWPTPPDQSAMIRALAIALLYLVVAMYFMMVGSMSQDLGRVEWSLEWLFTFPVPAWTIFLSKVIELALVNPFTWIVFWPFLFSIFACAGYGGWSVAIGGALAAYYGMILACLHLITETGLRKNFPPNRLKNIQAIFSLLGISAFLALMWQITAGPASFLIDLADRTPAAFLWNPFSLPIVIAEAGSTPGSLWAAVLLTAVLFTFATVRLAQWCVRDGLKGAGGPYRGARRIPSAAGPARGWTLSGVVGKDIRLLFRDRAFLMQTLVVPLIILGYNLIINPDFLHGASEGVQGSALLAFGLGAFVLMSSALHALSVESGALWMLYTVPRPLDVILRDKTYLWCLIALVYATAVLAMGAHSGVTAVNAIVAVAGVAIYSFIASGIGILATDPLEREQQKRIRPSMIYLYMILAAMYAHAIYNPSIWVKVTQIVLSLLLAFALWQKVRDHCPYFLDPVDSPPPSISLADGMIAVQAFFVIQGLSVILLSGWELAPGPLMLIAYVVAGMVVGIGALLVFWRQKVPDLFQKVGFRSSPEHAGVGVGMTIAQGIAGGILAAVLGLAYLHAADLIEPLRLLKEKALSGAKTMDPEMLAWIGGMAVFAAPVFEEFIFRGIIYRGLRRTMRPAWAVVLSAGLFTIVHPPYSWMPVFGLGIVTAFVFEKSRLLLAPFLAHMIYNLAVISASY
ncbi:MAG: hypothetical protein A3G34_00570 [Candidatus Lindowbacteria bacterium RIFCSPLOWO2_12_FULL_62_27]|nr:MAG: hypothetical protein A3G34_00570 [Candidatus Lindowbacteria bacterium RIFCSPLOWO2_12_FULL_62_27]OGH58191.1 MAG: hypothetical protein A3I06_00980 [Candidatus Lindowbacteria bacterium RIFCSPLOWO2_02_FULL_62_12]